MRFRVVGSPAPQGSKRAYAIRRGGVPTGKVAVVEQQGERVRSWRQAVVEEHRAALLASASAQPGTQVTIGPALGPVAVTLVFLLPRPKGHYRTGWRSSELRPSAPARPAKMPDLDKLCRATLDALTAAGCWADDAQVVDLNAAKVWCAPGEAPGAVIEIERADDE